MTATSNAVISSHSVFTSSSNSSLSPSSSSQTSANSVVVLSTSCLSTVTTTTTTFTSTVSSTFTSTSLSDIKHSIYTCHICNKSFNKIKSRNAHMKTHSDKIITNNKSRRQYI
ncbi:unnamed protein product [Schistosoma mattheei]|uniref:Uncharacterized protein n=1 Tax=Schistosoma mattheei TaxID=31246 RepID=A0A183Q478_9TREM|nr:unnamed protein product [Schistosoma mattheei]